MLSARSRKLIWLGRYYHVNTGKFAAPATYPNIIIQLSDKLSGGWWTQQKNEKFYLDLIGRVKKK